MDMITQWTYGDRPVRTVIEDSEVKFIAKDVCDVLSINDPSMAVKSLDEDEKGTSTIGTLGGQQEVLTVTEAGLYQLIFQSRKPEAKAFRRWVIHEVLPSIRKTGQYGSGESKLDTLASGARKIRASLAILTKDADEFLESYDETKKRGENFKESFKHERHIFDGLPGGAPPQSWFYIWLVVKGGGIMQVKTGICTNPVLTEQDYRRQNPKGRWLLKKLIAVDTIVKDLEDEIQDRVLPQEMRLRGISKMTESFDVPEYVISPFVVHCDGFAELTIENVQAYKRPATLWG